jgi:SET domain-containing protein
MASAKTPPPRDPAAGRTPGINPRYTRYRLAVRPSGIHRYGVFAEEFIPKGRKVIEYTGERISRRETARRSNGTLNYLFTLDNYWTLDGAVGGSGAEYVNHSCDPNCYAWIFKGHILYMAGRDIQPGEELTIDYRFEPDVERVPCKCGAANCRGTINLKKERKAPARRAKKAKKSGARR